MARRAKPTGEGRRVPLLSRTTPELRAELDQAAADSGRSLAQEVEARLQDSLNKENLLEIVLGKGPKAKLFGSILDIMNKIIQYSEQYKLSEEEIKTEIKIGISLSASRFFKTNENTVQHPGYPLRKRKEGDIAALSYWDWAMFREHERFEGEPVPTKFDKTLAQIMAERSET